MSQNSNYPEVGGSLDGLVLRWRRTAKGMHKIGRAEANRFNPAGAEYMQTAAAYLLCAKELAAEIKKAQNGRTEPLRGG